MLARGPGGWHWTFDAVRYQINGQVHALPPLYSVMLSLLALMPGLPHSALIVHVVLSTIAIGIVYGLGRLVHSPAVGLWAAGAYALSIPAIFNVWSTSQETLYIPLLLLAFWLLSRAVTIDARPPAFALAGAVFGLAALTRSMPMFFILPAAALVVVTAPARRAAMLQAAGLVGGFALVTVPYCIALSQALGQVTLIDSHGSIHVNAQAAADRAPGITATAQALWQRFAETPRAFLAGCVELARSLLHVNGGRQLQIYVVAANKSTALIWKVLVHLGTDVVLILAALLALPGAAWCRNTRVALLFLLWAGLNVAVTVLGGFSGARLRSPFEPFLMVLAAAVLAGNWRRRPAAVLAAAIAVSAAPCPSRSCRSFRAPFVHGPTLASDGTRCWRVTSGDLLGEAGFNVPASGGVARLTVQAAPVLGPRSAGPSLRRQARGQRRRWMAVNARSPGRPDPRA